ncbi:unnamed protein product [Brugia pahangi]|uniref:Mobile element protein n=1 Tax=Brugia pahangi TaxID=6280 RepID=A0A0N4T940_BRUPA|nr:unnamed protein product [Brugia pahangi]
MAIDLSYLYDINSALKLMPIAVVNIAGFCFKNFSHNRLKSQYDIPMRLPLSLLIYCVK